jgi:DNA-directed RNA polymerase specialized sigma subunit
VAHDLGWTLARLFHAMEAAGAGGLRVGDPPIEELERTVASTASHGATHHHLAVLAEAFMALSDREQLVLRMACEHCMHVEEMALVLGDNGDRVTRLHDGAIEKLAKRLHKPAARAACAHAPATPRPSALSAAH